MTVSNPPNGMHRVTPQLYYRDVDAAIAWLSENFSFELTEKHCGKKGDCIYAEIKCLDAAVLLAPIERYKDAESPKLASVFTMSVHVYVPNIERLNCELELKGVRFIEPLIYQVWGDKTLRVVDCEGHLWTFAEHVKDVSMTGCI